MASKATQRLPVTVVVTVLNEIKTVPSLLVALTKQTTLPEAVIMVDGGSQDGTIPLLKAAIKDYPQLNLQVLDQPGNRSLGRNAGIKAAKTELIAITDAGCQPKSGWLEALLTAAQTSLKAEPKTWPVVAGYYKGLATTPLEEAVIPYALVMPDRVNPDHFLPATRSMLLHKKAWETVGGFPTHLSDNEDYWLARQLERLARQPHPTIRLLFTDKAIVLWFPRSSLTSFWTMTYRFARGDAYAGLWRSKVAIIFLRYVIVAGVVGGALYYFGIGWGVAMLVAHLGLYSSWSIQKNYRYVPRGWYWLPILQHISDFAVICGTLRGLQQKYLFS